MLWSDYTEPARLRAAGLAIVQFCAALGIVLPFDLPGLVEAAVAILALLLPVITGELIRAKVTPSTGRHAAPEEVS